MLQGHALPGMIGMCCTHGQVHPLWQRGGLGRGLMERLTAALVADGVNAVTLFAEPNVVRMYEKLGFLTEPRKVQGLSFQRSSPAGAALVASCQTQRSRINS